MAFPIRMTDEFWWGSVEDLAVFLGGGHTSREEAGHWARALQRSNPEFGLQFVKRPRDGAPLLMGDRPTLMALLREVPRSDVDVEALEAKDLNDLVLKVFQERERLASRRRKNLRHKYIFLATSPLLHGLKVGLSRKPLAKLRDTLRKQYGPDVFVESYESRCARPLVRGMRALFKESGRGQSIFPLSARDDIREYFLSRLV